VKNPVIPVLDKENRIHYIYPSLSSEVKFRCTCGQLITITCDKEENLIKEINNNKERR